MAQQVRVVFLRDEHSPVETPACVQEFIDAFAPPVGWDKREVVHLTVDLTWGEQRISVASHLAGGEELTTHAKVWWGDSSESTWVEEFSFASSREAAVFAAHLLSCVQYKGAYSALVRTGIAKVAPGMDVLLEKRGCDLLAERRELLKTVIYHRYLEKMLSGEELSIW